MLVVWLGVPVPGYASGYGSARFGGEHATAADTSPAALYYNPAAIGLLDGQHLMVDLTLALRSASYLRSPDAIDPSSLQAAQDAGLERSAAVEALAGEATLNQLVVLPFAGFTTDLGMPESPLRLGAAFFVPFGGQSSWDRQPQSEDFPGAVDGVSRWYNIAGTIRSLAGAFGLAYRVPSARLSFGLVGNLYYSQVDTIRARNANGTDNLVAADGSLLEGRSLLTVSGMHLGVGAGVLWETLPDALWIGMSYQSQPGFGTMELSGTLDNTLGTARPSPAADVVFTQALPDIFRLGARARVAQAWELRLGVDWTRWGQLEQMCLANAAVADVEAACATGADGSLANPAYAGDVTQVFQRRWEDAFGVRVSGSYFPSEVLELMAGAGFDGNAIPDATLDPALYDMNKLSFSLAAAYRVAPAWELILTLTEVLYLERDTRGTTGNGAFASPSRQPVNAGRYRQNILLIQPGVRVRL